jgi:hypothetical protein
VHKKPLVNLFHWRSVFGLVTEGVERKGVVKSKPNFKQSSRCKKQPNITHHRHRIEPATALATGAPWIVMELIGGATNEVSPGHELIGR